MHFHSSLGAQKRTQGSKRNYIILIVPFYFFIYFKHFSNEWKTNLLYFAFQCDSLYLYSLHVHSFIHCSFSCFLFCFVRLIYFFTLFSWVFTLNLDLYSKNTKIHSVNNVCVSVCLWTLLQVKNVKLIWHCGPHTAHFYLKWVEPFCQWIKF